MARAESVEAPVIEPAVEPKTAPISAVPQETVAVTPSTLVAQASVLTEPPSQAPANSLVLPLAETAASGANRSVLTSQLVLLCLWAIGACVVAVPFLLMLLVQWCRNRGLDLIQDDRWNASIRALSQRLNLVRSVTTFKSNRGTAPAVFGILRPYLVVPSNWRDWSDQQRTCILLHELAHVKRLDVARQFLGRLAVMLYWFNPLAWYAVRQLRIERELACDDCVLRSGQRASDYAQQLLRTLKLCRTQRFATGVAMAHSARLDRRVLAILDQTRCRLPMSRSAIGVGLLCAVVMTAVLGAVSFAARSRADDSNETTANPDVKDVSQQAPSNPDDPKVAGRYSGRVTSTDGKPVRGARVFVIHQVHPDDAMVRGKANIEAVPAQRNRLLKHRSRNNVRFKS